MRRTDMPPDCEGFRRAEAFVYWFVISVVAWFLLLAGAMVYRAYHGVSL